MVWFTADIHFGHSNILGFHDRSSLGKTIEEHDESIIQMWNDTVAKKDTIYILGDIGLVDGDRLRRILHRLNGNKILIKGNHDRIPTYLEGHFNQITLHKCFKFKASVYSEITEDFEVVMCHYPIVTWENKQRGSVMIHGHCHGSIDKYNTNSKELRVDVGLDSELSQLRFVSLERLYNHFKKIAGGVTLKEYAKLTYNKFPQ